jgi:tetratricopeptide (TPR) repeat protein
MSTTKQIIMGEVNKAPEGNDTNEEQFTSEDWMEKGIEQLNLKNYALAITNFNRAIEMDHDNLDALLHKGFAEEKLEHFHVSIDIFEKLIELGKPSDIVKQAKEFLDTAINNQKLARVRNMRKKIRSLGEGDIFNCVTCFLLVAIILNVIFFINAASIGFLEFGFIISIVIYIVFMTAWVNVKKKFDSSSEILKNIYEEMREKLDEEKEEENA